MTFFNDSLVTQKLSVDYLNIDDGSYEMLINNDDGKTAHKCWVKKDDRCSCHCPTFQMYRMMCTHLGKGLRHLKHFGYIGDLTTGAVSASVFPNFVLMKDIRASVLQIPILGYELKDFIDIANIHARKTQLEPPPVYKLNPLKDTEHRIRSIGEVGFKNKTCQRNHFNLGNRFTFQSEKVKVKYYSDKTLTYFGGLMKAGWFDIGWKGHNTCMPIEKKSINMTLVRTSAYHKRYTCSGCGLSDKYGRDHNIRTFQQHL